MPMSHGDAGERRTTQLLAALYFLLALSYQLGQSAAYALFVDRFGRDDLPFAFLLMPVFGIAITSVLIRVTRRSSLRRILLIELSAIGVMGPLLRLGIGAHHPPTIFFLPVWDGLTNGLSNLAVWSLVGRLFDVRQAKRIAPVIVAGRAGGLVIGGLATRPLVALIGTSNLYLLQPIALIGAAAVVWTIHQLHAESFGLPQDRVRRRLDPDRSANASTRSFGRYLLSTVFITAVAYAMIRNLYLDRTAAQFPTASHYATAIGLVGAVHGVSSLLGSLLVTRRFMARFGAGAAILALPLVVLALYGGFVVLGATGAPSSSLFVVAVSGYAVAGLLMHGLRTPAIQVMYQPMPVLQRGRLMTSADGVVEPLAIGAGGLILVLLTKVLHQGSTGMATALVAVAMVGLAAGRELASRYRFALTSAVRRRLLHGELLDLTNKTTADAVAQVMDEGDAAAVVSLLAIVEPSAGSLAVGLLRHDEAEVRRLAISRLDDEDRDWAALAARSDPDADVRAAALERLGRAASAELVTLALSDPSDGVQRAALLVSCAPGASADVRAIGTRAVFTRAASGDLAARRMAASLLAEVAVPGLGELLAGDGDPQIRTAMLKARCRAQDRDAIESAAAALATDRRRTETAPATAVSAADAIVALVAAGDGAVPTICALAISPGADARVARRAIRCLHGIATPAASAALASIATTADAGVRSAALAVSDATGATFGPAALLTQLRIEIAEAAADLHRLRSIDGARIRDVAATALVQAILRERVAGARDRCALLLRCGPHRETMHRVGSGLGREGPADSYAVELLDTTLDLETRRVIVPLFAGDIANPALMLRTLAPHLDSPPERDPLGSLLIDRDPMVAAVARRAFDHPTAMLAHDNEGAMNLVDRLIILRRVEAFADVPPDLLIDLARLFEDVALTTGDVLFEAGESGECMYVVVAGTLRIEAVEGTIDHIGAHQVLGELALLDGEPRSATVTAESESLLYRLDAETFYELMSERPEVLRGIIRTVMGRLRARMSDISALREELRVSQLGIAETLAQPQQIS